MTKLRAFLLAIVVGAAAILIVLAINKPTKSDVPATTENYVLLDDVSVRNQVALADMVAIRAKGFRTLIDLRPDGEASDEPGSTDVADAAHAAGLQFAYVPTPHGDIPATVVGNFSQALAAAPRPVLLYCRSGKRAARVWALAEASLPGGADAETIANAVRRAGQPVDDLASQIAVRIAARKSGS